MYPDYDFELERVAAEIRNCGAKLVGLQFPEGLKKYAVDIASAIEATTEATTLTFIGPVYGACDTKEREAKTLGLDLIVHFGHSALKPKLSKRR